MKKKVLDPDIMGKVQEAFEKDSLRNTGSIGRLFYCNSCNNVHRPGPCVDLGIDPAKFSKKMKK